MRISVPAHTRLEEKAMCNSHTLYIISPMIELGTAGAFGSGNLDAKIAGGLQ